MSCDRQLSERVTVAVCRVLGVGIASVGTQVENGIVQLSGVVDTPDERDAVERAVWAVPGVRAIVRRLRVRRTYPGGPTDRALAGEALTSLVREGLMALQVRVEEGVVTLRGAFRSAAERDAAIGAVARIAGVRGIRIAEEPSSMEADQEVASLPMPASVASRIRGMWN